MARAFIGNFKGPKGDKGETGPQGKQGNTGATGQRGSRWTEGTKITGTSTTAGIFSGTGIADALVNDMYLNTSTGNVYRCTVGGAASVAKWVFVGCIKGAKGDKGDRGATGATGPQGPRGEKGATGAQGPSGTADTSFTEAATLTKLASGESFKAMLGKIAKAVSTIFDKFDKKNIVNNQTTTKEGFALDARQANPNLDGTLAKQLSDLNGSLNKADENTLSNWMAGYSILGAGFAVQIPSINNYNFSSKKIKIFTTSGWQDCTSQPDFVSKFGSGYNVFYREGLPEGLEYGKAFLCQFI